MKCLLCRFACFWDTPKARASARAHAARCGCCAAREARREALTSRLTAGAGNTSDLHEALIATTLRSLPAGAAGSRTVRAAPHKPRSSITTWLPLVAGMATAGVVALLIYPQTPAPAAAPNPQAGLLQVSAGATQIASALAHVPNSLNLGELHQLAAGIGEFPGWGPPSASPAEKPSGFEQFRDTVDPLGITDKTKWKPIRNWLGS